MIKVSVNPVYAKKLKIPFTPKYIKSINGNDVIDLFDILFNFEEENNIIEFVDMNGKRHSVNIKTFDSENISYEAIKPKNCGCKCIFCFIDQLPPGLRRTLYKKDEDYRFSYMYGNYITLANITEKDIERIIRYKLTPLYVSVHATDEKVRSFMLGRKKLPPIMELLGRLSSRGIRFHTQIVLCPGINDENIFKKTIEDLSSFYPLVESVAVVPVGLTEHRKGLYPLRRLNEVDAKKAFQIVNDYQKKYLKIFSHPLVYLSDEFYILLNRPVPSTKFYRGFPQYENGVGILRRFIDNAERLLKRDLKNIKMKAKVGVVTGEISYKIVKYYLERLSEKTGVNITLLPVKNRLFGELVNVTGLIGGNDIIEALKGKRFDKVFIPDVMLLDKEDHFLDDVTVKDLGKILQAEIISFAPNLSNLYNKIINNF